MTVKTALQKDKTMQKHRIPWAISTAQFFWPHFRATKCTGKSLQQRIPKHMPGLLSRSLLASPLKRIWLTILDSMSQLSRMHQSQPAITTTAHKTATLHYVTYVRHGIMLCASNNKLSANDSSRGYKVIGQGQTLDGIRKHHVKFQIFCDLSIRSVSTDWDN
jgi:hypothetical protein